MGKKSKKVKKGVKKSGQRSRKIKKEGRKGTER
jgi:hypothetical protein